MKTVGLWDPKIKIDYNGENGRNSRNYYCDMQIQVYTLYVLTIYGFQPFAVHILWFPTLYSPKFKIGCNGKIFKNPLKKYEWECSYIWREASL